MSLYYIGTSGWHYDHWRHRFYPEKLAKAKWLEFYAGWAKRLASLAANLKAVYIYFNNDAEAFAVRNAVTLRGYLQPEIEFDKSL